MKKKCGRCKRALSLTFFRTNNHTKDGYDCYCIECKREYGKRWRESNREHFKELQEQWYQNNKEHIFEYKKSWKANNPNYYKEYYAKNGDKIKEQKKKYFLENPEKKEQYMARRKAYYMAHREKYREYNKAYRESNKDSLNKYRNRYYKDNKDKVSQWRKKYRLKNKDKIIQRTVEWQKNNPEKVKETQKRYHERNKTKVYARQKKWRAKNKDKYRMTVRGHTFLKDSIKRAKKGKASMSGALGLAYGDFFDYLAKTYEDSYGEKYNGQEVHIDHKIPLSEARNIEEIKYLTHYTNLQYLTPEDNMQKSNKILPEFRKEYAAFLDFRKKIKSKDNRV